MSQASVKRPPFDPEVIIRAKRGERDAIEKLFGDHLPTIHRFALRMCRNEEEARDIAQESLLTALHSLDGFRGEASFSTWLFTIARSHCGRLRRRVEREPVGDQHDVTTHETESSEPAPDEHAMTGELTRLVERVLHEMDEADREVLVLRDVEGVSTKEAAEIIGISVAALKSWLHRARTTLRERVRAAIERRPEQVDPACPDILERFSRKLEGELSTTDCEWLEKHLQECPTCAHRCDSLKQVLGACAALRNEPVDDVVGQVIDRAIDYVHKHDH